MGRVRLNQILQSLKQRGEKAFIPYLMAGDGGIEKLEDHIRFMTEEGATLIEIGIPFSDPIADGPTIQRAGKRSLDHGTTIMEIFQTIKRVRTYSSIPLVFMTYLNPILAFGKERFVQLCVEAGVDGMIIPDIPYEEKELIAPDLRVADIALIPLVTLTSPLERIDKIIKEGDGFVYAVTVTGVTGSRTAFQKKVYTYLQQVTKRSNLPVFAGFGISNPKQTQEILAFCDGVIVGSKVIEAIEEGNKNDIKELIHAVRQFPNRYPQHSDARQK
ncbi:tryptophan synthase subunit alpha [Risungbinella massiliensis]|uniref:tryptophan synthase subunit alpha n=1 Tax=Risungbinella massiliensis TaxID=1329796 RepID=UPI0005CB8B4E|nr:tryptophan synthase subunit alpha [Risungbinella massiliensis]